jgi:hypothetical protein
LRPYGDIQDDATSPAALSLPSGDAQDTPTTPAVATTGPSSTAAPRRPIAASFIHPIASLDDPTSWTPPPQAPQLTSPTNNAASDDDDDWINYFPHNFDYSVIGSSYTREDLVGYFDPDNYVTIGIEDGEEFEKRELVGEFRDAAGQGWDAAAYLDEAPHIDDEDENVIKPEGENVIKSEDDGTEKTLQAARKAKVKEEGNKMNKAFDDFLLKFDLPLVKAAAKAGYLARKKIECLKNGKKFFICRHGDGPGPGCLTNQYSSERVRSAISDYFGRNKKETKQIPNMMKWCRKHYQQDGYKDGTWQKTKKRHIVGQLEQNEADLQRDGHKGLRYEIRLRVKDEKRRRDWKEQKGTKGEPTQTDKHPADLDVLQHIFDQYCEKGQTQEKCKELIDWAYNDYAAKVKKWMEGKDEKTINRDIKVAGPKFVEFQMLPEYKQFYSKKELDAREFRGPKTPKKNTDSGTPPSKKTPKRERKNLDDDSDQDESPSKKTKKK